MADTVARVLIDSALPQLDRLFDYRVPDALVQDAQPGVRVRVPLRHATSNGFIIGLEHDSGFVGELAQLDSVVSTVPVLAPEVYRLARAVADRQAGNASDVIRLAVPTRQVRVEKAFVAAVPPEPEQVQATSVTGYPDRLVEEVRAGARLVVSAMPTLVRAVDGAWIGAWARTIAELAATVIAGGRSVIVACPDYRDLDQVQAALAGVLPPTAVTRLDATQSNAARYAAFLTARFRGPQVVIGNRSVVYSASEDLGLIIVWDDGDPLFTEPLSPYANARDVALLRQEQQGCALVFMGNTRTTATQRLVEIGWLTEIAPSRSTKPSIVLTETQAAAGPSGRIPSSAWQTARTAAATGPILVQVARPGSASLAPAVDGEPRLAPDAGRTAFELGRAFPGIRVIVSEGETPLVRVDGSPALVVATRGAEPIADGGYRAVLLLDAERMLSRENLWVAEDCLRWWSNAAVLAAPKAPVFLVGVGGDLGTAFATWRQQDWAARELGDRRALRFPPAVRVVTVTGTGADVAAAVDAVKSVAATTVAMSGHDGLIRAALTFEYRDGAVIAGALRGAVIRNASARRRPASRTTPTLRVRFDDSEFAAS